jgi:CheY-like chemotaxis protein
MSGTEASGGGSTGSVAEAARAARIATARADFITNLGRRVAELRAGLKGLEHEPGSARLQGELRRRIHALAAGAKLLRFGAMAAALGEAAATLDRAAHAGPLGVEEIRSLGETVESLPSLAWGEPKAEMRATERPPPSSPLGEAGTFGATVLLVGPQGFADAIADEPDVHGGALECERCDVETAPDLARAFGPDVIVLDADLSGAADLLEKLVHDPLLEIPVVAVGTWGSPEHAAKWLSLGATRALAKPVSPNALRGACRDLAAATGPIPAYAPLGDLTIDQLAARLADEVRRGLCDGVVPHGRTAAIPLGNGAEVLAALWAAVARVREVVTIKTDGAVRFTMSGPEGALPIALWWGHEPAVGDRGGSARGEPETLLDGRRAVVADDDPAVAWFLASVLRAAGAKVYEAHDGDKALELCFRHIPDLVITDVLMPGLDGFALCRALKRDIALRDVPVILLSWKEDLLQRLRELGADADGYLRKEASAAAILQRTSEVLRPRLRIEGRLRGDGEVRGRLDGITARTLLEMVARLRPDARICIHDASFLYEIEMRAGAPKSATRTTSDGVFQRGPEIFGAMLGVRAGRFVVSRADGPVRGILTGGLNAQMIPPMARARAAAKLLGGTHLLEVHRVAIDLDRVSPYLGATPESARTLVERLARGASPRAMIVGGEVAPGSLEDVLCDLAAHGAVASVYGQGGDDLLEAAIDVELRVLQQRDLPSSPPEPPLPPKSVAGPLRSASRPLARIAPVPAPQLEAPRPIAKKEPSPHQPPPPPEDPFGDAAWDLGGDALAGATAAVARAPGQSPAVSPDPSFESPAPADEPSPSSLEAAVMRELSDWTPAPEPSSRSAEPAPETIVDASSLRARNSSVPREPDKALPIPSLPPDAVVPEADAVPIAAPEQPVFEAPLAFDDETDAPVRSSARPSAPPPSDDPHTSWFFGATLVLVGLGLVAFAVRFGMERLAQKPSTAAPTVSVVAVASAPPGVAIALPTPAGSLEAASSATPVAASAASVPEAAALARASAAEDLPLPQGTVLSPGQGLLDIETGGREAIFVDGVELGRGPALRIALAPGVHEVRLRVRGEDRVRFVLIRTGRRARLAITSPWNR